MNDIYKLLEFLDNKIVELQDESYEFNAKNLNYSILDDNTINLSFGWSSPEEYQNFEGNIILNNNITLSAIQTGKSVYLDGEYTNEYDEIFNDVNNLIEFINSEI